jgi:two-component system chemotaxis response regulator CheY
MALSILTVENSSVTRRQLTHFLTLDGQVVHEAESGEEGLNLLHKHHFDLVIAGLEAPGMDCVEFVRQTRELPGYDLVPIFLLTTETRPSQKLQADAAGATGWMRKPFTVDMVRMLLCFANSVKAMGY